MMKSSLMRNVAVSVSALVFAAMPSLEARAQDIQQMQLTKIPKSYTTGNTVFNNLEGYIVTILNYDKVQKIVPDLEAYQLDCSAIHPSMKKDRDECYAGKVKYCSELYSKSTYKPAARYDELVPTKPVQAHANYYSVKNTNKNVIAINLGFFDTRAFPNRSTDQTKWKPIYQEACGLNLGTYKSGIANVPFVSNFADRQVKSDGSLDKPFGTFVFRVNSDGSVGSSRALNSSIEDKIVSGTDTAINGVYLRYDGKDQVTASANFPDFVKEKANSKVGRTVIGLNNKAKVMKIVVVQGGPGVNTGISIDDARKFFGVDYTYVMLLDGSGSSQLAANFLPKTPIVETTPGRTSCMFTAIRTCTKQGDSVENAFVSHWDARYRTADPAKTGHSIVDRWTPNVLILMTDK